MVWPESTEREAVAGVLAIARNASVPFGASYKGFGIYNTEYRTVIDLNSRRYFFESIAPPTTSTLFQSFWPPTIYRETVVQPGLQPAGQHPHLFYSLPPEQLRRPGAGSLVGSTAI